MFAYICVGGTFHQNFKICSFSHQDLLTQCFLSLFIVFTHLNNHKVWVFPYQGILQHMFIMWVNTLVLGVVAVWVVVDEMITAEHADHSKQVNI